MSLPGLNIKFAPLASPDAIVAAAGVRFSILTERLIRLECSPNGQFEDRPSQAFWVREQPVPAFEVRRQGSILEIDTGNLLLQYTDSPAGFTPHSLSILVRETGKTWRYGQNNGQGGNLKGTARTLDGAGGEVELGTGILGRAGWALVDDSSALVFDENGWLTSRNASRTTQDLYFFGYGHAYREALSEFIRVSGSIPMIPRWALGNWWSRYWPYSADELLGLMQDFKEHQIPLSVCIVDMDWHLTQTGNDSSGWTGYTWNTDLFPNPKAFMAKLHEMGLKTALNLHPAEGIHSHEIQYPIVARRMGIDPASGDPIAFNIADPLFAQVYFEELHHPQEADGVDFWWMDWQQGTRSEVSGLDPLWWLNHLHFYDLARNGDKRAFVFSRWGGLGNHRYPIGFSGDTLVTWEALANQPSFTSTAANVAYGWWSHDIGGHMGGVEDDELYTRWLQYGVFSPIFRLHSTRNNFLERRPWARGAGVREVASETMRMRTRFISYIYSAAWQAHQTGEVLITPMYYTHPEEADAYQCQQQYWFGRELVAAPFTTPARPETQLAQQRIWLPGGEWFDFFTGEKVTGHGWMMTYGDLGKIPVWAKAGAIVPLDSEHGLEVYIFPGADNKVTLYNDDGESDQYKQGAFALTHMAQTWCDSLLRFEIAPATGQADLISPLRKVQLLVRGITRPEMVQITLDGASQIVGWLYDNETETLILDSINLPVSSGLVLEVGARFLGQVRSRRAENALAYLRAFKLDTWVKGLIYNDIPRLLSGEYDLRRYEGLTVEQLTALSSALGLVL
jgi:hypothetical protein